MAVLLCNCVNLTPFEQGISLYYTLWVGSMFFFF
jgi:hypothetical protein